MGVRTGVVKLEIKDSHSGANNGRFFKKIYSPSLGKLFYLDDTGYSPGEYAGHECGGKLERSSDVVINCPFLHHRILSHRHAWLLVEGVPDREDRQNHAVHQIRDVFP